MAVYIENGGFGAQYAVPIAGLLIEKYLKGCISPHKKALEQRMMESSLITPAAQHTAKERQEKIQEEE